LFCVYILCSVEHSSTFSDKADTGCKLDIDIAEISSYNIGRCFSKLDVKNDNVGGTWGNRICRGIVIDVVARSILVDEDN